MASTKKVEKKIWDVEGFEVEILLEGRNIRDDKEGLPSYTFTNKANKDK